MLIVGPVPQKGRAGFLDCRVEDVNDRIFAIAGAATLVGVILSR
jgi:hypothetical protein